MNFQDKYCNKCHKEKLILIDEYEYIISGKDTFSIDKWEPDSHLGGFNPGVLFSFYTKSVNDEIQINVFYNGNPSVNYNISSDFVQRWTIYDECGNVLSFLGVDKVTNEGFSDTKIVKLVVNTIIGKRWQGAKEVIVDFTNVFRKIKIYGKCKK